jgi:hypothetical protein
MLDSQRRALRKSRADLLEHQAIWLTKQTLLSALTGQRQAIAQGDGTLGYQEKLVLIEALRVRVLVWSMDHSPRFEIQTGVERANAPVS